MTFTHITAYTLAEPPMRLFTLKAPAVSLPPPPLQLLPGGTNQFPGGFIPPLKNSAFHSFLPAIQATGLGLLPRWDLLPLIMQAFAGRTHSRTNPRENLFDTRCCPRPISPSYLRPHDL